MQSYFIVLTTVYGEYLTRALVDHAFFALANARNTTPRKAKRGMNSTKAS